MNNNNNKSDLEVGTHDTAPRVCWQIFMQNCVI